MQELITGAQHPDWDDLRHFLEAARTGSFRSAAAARPAEGGDEWLAFDDPAIAAPLSRAEPGGRSILLLIDGLTCAACSWLLTQVLERTAGVLRSLRRVAATGCVPGPGCSVTIPSGTTYWLKQPHEFDVNQDPLQLLERLSTCMDRLLNQPALVRLLFLRQGAQRIERM